MTAREPSEGRTLFDVVLVLPRVIAVEHCRSYGLTADHVRTLLRRGLWSRLCSGVVLTRPEVPARTDWASAALIAGGASSAISGLDAVRMAGLRSATGAGAPVLVLTTGRDRRAIPSVRVRATRRPYETWLTTADDEPAFSRVVRPARALADLGSIGVRPWAVRALVTEAVQREVCSVDDLARELESGPRRDSAALRAAIGDLDAGARSIAEVRAIDELRRCAAPAFEVNVPVVRGGTTIAVVDLLWRALRAVVEIDGRRHHDGPLWTRTLTRHNALTACGLAVRHDAPTDLGQAWAREVTGWLRARAAELGVEVGSARGSPPAGPPPPLLVP